MKRLSKEKSLFALCWCTYVLTYLCRVNFSSVMEKLSLETHISLSQLGVIGSGFFLAYALGQIVNGFLGDRISPFFFIPFAITMSGVLNLCMAGCSQYNQLLLVWSCNGYVQSMLWGPIMRILAEHFPAGKRMKASVGMSSSMVAGFLLSWTVFGRGFLSLSRRWYFLVPALCAIAMGLFWIFFSAGNKSQGKAEASAVHSGETPPAVPHAFLPLFFTKRIWLIALTCFCLGNIKESVSFWAPTLMTRMLGVEINQSFLLISIIPLFNMGGILAAGVLIQKNKGSIKRSLLLLFLAALSCSLFLFLFYEANAMVSVLLIAAVSGIMYGCNTILLSYVPISFGRYHLTSTLVGIFDFLSYLGAALSSWHLGNVVAFGSFRGIFTFWMGIGICAIGLICFYRLKGSETKCNYDGKSK